MGGDKKMSGFLSDVGGAISDGVDVAERALSKGIDAVGSAVSKGIDTINNACNKASDPIENITETVVNAPDMLVDMVADSTVGQYWSDFWDLEIDSVDAIVGWLEDTAEELANDEDVPGFIRNYMNGFIGADVPYTYLGEYGATLRGAGNSLSGMWKGISSMLGHPCQTEANLVNTLIMSGDATKYFANHPKIATKKDSNKIYNWWNSKNAYEKTSTKWEVFTDIAVVVAMWEASADSAGGETAEIIEEAGETSGIAAKAGGASGIVGSEGDAAVEGVARKAAGAIDEIAGEAAEG